MFELSEVGRRRLVTLCENPLEGEAEVGVPQRVEADSPVLPTAAQAGVIAIAVGDQLKGPCNSLCLKANATGHFFEKRCRGRIDEPVDAPHIEGIHVEFAKPVQCAFDEIPPDLVASGSVEMDPVSRAREVRSERGKRVPLEPRLKEGQAEQDGEALSVAGIDEALQSWRTAPLQRYGKMKTV